MEDTLFRIWNDLIIRPSGPLSIRFFMQPTIAVILAIRSGIRDARLKKAPFLWTVFTNKDARKELLHSGWKDTARLFTFAICLDIVFQAITFKRLYPGEALLIAFMLAILPYILVRGPVNRIVKTKP